MRRLAAAALLALALPLTAFGQASEVASPDPRTEERLKGLAQELRCLVCQNQTIADSNAPLAVDLRSQIRTQIAAGRSDAQIRDYMVARYGDFVLYRPPFKASTALLWMAPLLLLAGGAAVFVVVLRRRAAVGAQAQEKPLAPGERERLAKLLEEGPPAGEARRE